MYHQVKMRNLFAVLMCTLAATFAIGAGLNSTSIEGKVDGESVMDFIVRIALLKKRQMHQKGIGTMISLSRVVTAADVLFKKETFLGVPRGCQKLSPERLSNYHVIVRDEVATSSLEKVIPILDYVMDKNYEYHSHINNVAVIKIDPALNPFVTVSEIQFPALASYAPVDRVLYFRPENPVFGEDPIKLVIHETPVFCKTLVRKPSKVFDGNTQICAWPFDQHQSKLPGLYDDNDVGNPVFVGNTVHGIYLTCGYSQNRFLGVYMLKLGSNKMIQRELEASTNELQRTLEGIGSQITEASGTAGASSSHQH